MNRQTGSSLMSKWIATIRSPEKVAPPMSWQLIYSDMIWAIQVRITSLHRSRSRSKNRPILLEIKYWKTSTFKRRMNFNLTSQMISTIRERTQSSHKISAQGRMCSLVTIYQASRRYSWGERGKDTFTGKEEGQRTSSRKIGTNLPSQNSTRNSTYHWRRSHSKIWTKLSPKTTTRITALTISQHRTLTPSTNKCQHGSRKPRKSWPN